MTIAPILTRVYATHQAVPATARFTDSFEDTYEWRLSQDVIDQIQDAATPNVYGAQVIDDVSSPSERTMLGNLIRVVDGSDILELVPIEGA